MSAGNYFADPILNPNQFLHCLCVSLVQSVNWLWASDANKFWIVKDVKSFNKSLAPWISTIVWRCQGMRYFEREKYLTVRGIVRRHNILISALCTPVVNAVDAVVVAQDDKEWTGKLWCCDDVVSESDTEMSEACHGPWPRLQTQAAERFIITIHYFRHKKQPSSLL